MKDEDIRAITAEIRSWPAIDSDEPLECPYCKQELSLTCCGFEEEETP